MAKVAMGGHGRPIMTSYFIWHVTPTQLAAAQCAGPAMNNRSTMDD